MTESAKLAPTPKGLNITAQGRRVAAHPGKDDAPFSPTLKGLYNRSPIQPFQGWWNKHDFASQGAPLRGDPGL